MKDCMTYQNNLKIKVLKVLKCANLVCKQKYFLIVNLKKYLICNVDSNEIVGERMKRYNNN